MTKCKKSLYDMLDSRFGSGVSFSISILNCFTYKSKIISTITLKSNNAPLLNKMTVFMLIAQMGVLHHPFNTRG